MDNIAHSCVCFVSVSEFGFIITHCTKTIRTAKAVLIVLVRMALSIEWENICG